jgi:hypothetical protein
MNPVKQRFLVFCVFMLVIAAGIAMIVVRSITGPLVVNPELKTKIIVDAEPEHSANMNDRLSVDDNSSIAFLYGADMQGSLDVCG